MKPAAKRRGQTCPFKLLVALALLTGTLASISAPGEEVDLTNRPVVGRGADGQLELFEVDAAGRLKQRVEKKFNGDWSPWCGLEGTFLPGIATANAADGRLKIFAVERTSHELKCISQNTTNDLDWSDWLDLGGNVR